MNRLAHEPSLYLRQHAENPVDWYPWGEEALERARELDRPILLSIGYSACHWCHVMAHECFEDEAIAAVMNESFVNVKVDREERPDLDALYMQATLALTGQGGWPMTVFLTAEGHPYYAGTYFPPEPRGGLPGFADLCRALAEAHRSQRDQVVAQAAKVVRALERAAEREPSPGAFDGALEADALLGLARAFDPIQGGFGGAPKFPPSTTLEYLIARAEMPDGDRHAREMAEVTLARMAAGGIHDHVGGGFHRYTVDGQWLVPHFEKMLYDNAQLARVYAHAHRVTGSGPQGAVATATLDYLLREMRLPERAFAAAQDADTAEGEGAFFVWTPAQLAEVLPDDQARAITLRYGVSEAGNWEGRTILRPAMALDEVTRRLGTDAAPLLTAARRTLYSARAARPRPVRDDKIITAWNGLAIAALADAGRILQRHDFVDAAVGAAAFLLDAMVVDGRLHRTHMAGQPRGEGQLDDHAHLCEGLLALYRATFQPRWLSEARRWAGAMVERFADPANGGFFYRPTDLPGLVARTRDLEDHPSPSGNSQAALVLVQLAALTGDDQLRTLGEGALALVRDEVARSPQAFGTALLALRHLQADGRQVVIAGRADDPATAALTEVAQEVLRWGDSLTVGDPDNTEAVEAAPLLAGRPLLDGDTAAAYVCRDFHCRAPVGDPDALRDALA